MCRGRCCVVGAVVVVLAWVAVAVVVYCGLSVAGVVDVAAVHWCGNSCCLLFDVGRCYCSVSLPVVALLLYVGVVCS